MLLSLVQYMFVSAASCQNLLARNIMISWMYSIGPLGKPLLLASSFFILEFDRVILYSLLVQNTRIERVG